MTAPAGCGSAAAPQVTAEDTARARTQWPDATIEELEAGRRIFVGRCGSCHQLPNPARIASQRWPKIIADKRARANLSDEQVVVLERYLVTMAGRNARN